MKAFILATIFFGLLSTQAEARHHIRSTGLDPSCNVTMPCQMPMSAAAVRESERVARGGYVANQIGIGGVAPRRQVAHRHRKEAIHHRRLSQTPQHNARRQSHPREAAATRVTSIGNGVVKAASGAIAYVAGRATSAFQCVIDRLEAEGYPVKFMGGFARGGHIRHSLHYVGLALDINQLERNVTKPRMPSNEIQLANSCGLVSGAQWANGDSGHFQLGGWTGGGRHYAHRHTRMRYAHYWRHKRYATR